MEKFGFEKYIDNCNNENCAKGEGDPIADSITTFKERILYALNYAKNIIKKICLYIIIGIGIGAFLHGYIPTEFFVKYTSSNNIFVVPLAVILGIPLYANATGIIPIAEVLLEKGVPIGTVLAMMMSVVGISFPELVILRRVLKVRLLAYFCIVFINCFYLCRLYI